LRSDLIAHIDDVVRPADFPADGKRELWDLYYVAIRHNLDLATRMDGTILSLSPEAYESTLSSIETADPSTALRLERLKRKAEGRKLTDAVSRGRRYKSALENAEKKLAAVTRIAKKNPGRGDNAVLLEELDKSFIPVKFFD
jgi:hypothetical protein